MPPLFPPWSNVAFAVALGTATLAAGAAVGAPMIYMRTPYATHQYQAWEQPVEFDHRHHVRDDVIDCLYCHPGAENQRFAGIPTTATCMGCHNQVWPESAQLAPVRRSAFEAQPIAWRRVHDLPDFVYFHHGVHVQGGIACARCHGPVEDMARVYRVAPLTMDWCLECHRDPPGPARHGRALTSLTTCTACHR